MLNYSLYNNINESVRSELFDNGMCVMYSKSGKSADYYTYLCLTEKEDIEKALDKLKWPNVFSTSDAHEMLDDRYGILVTSREDGCKHILISEVLANNILYIWNTKLKLDDLIKDEYLKDLKEFCKQENLIYEKDVDLKNIVTLLPDEPVFNYGYKSTDWADFGRFNTAWSINHSPRTLGNIVVPSPKNI